MRACCLLLLAALRTVAAGTPEDAGSSVASHEQATSSSLCEPASLLGFPPLSSDALPTDLLALTHVANDTARVLAVWMAEDPLPDLDFTLAAQARTLVEAHPQLTAAVVALPRRRDASVVAYRKDSRTHVVLLNGVGSWNHSSTLEVYWRNSETAWNKTMGLLSQPFWDCFTGAWVFGYNVPLPGEHRGAAGIYFSVDHLNIDQCNESYTSLFGAHICDPETAMCVPELGEGNRRGYTCACKPGFFAQESRLHWRFFNVAQSSLYRCAPCPPDCDMCDGASSTCWAPRDYLLRTSLLGVQVICMCITLVLAIIVFKQRKCKTIASGMWTMLETILLGIMLLYATVVVRFFDPSVEQCLLEPWCRELGFVICYGAIILKLYRILIEFRTRKAHRWVVRDKDLLKYLLGMVVVVFGYMAAWTATNLNFIQEDYDVVSIGRTYEGLQFLACKALWWDYVTETGEILILVFGIHLSYACRNASTQFQERRFLCLAIMVEATVSGIFYVLRVVYSGTLHPDYSFLAYFTRSQLTSTVVLLVIFIPKLWYQHKHVTDSRSTRHYLTQEFSARVPLDAFKPQDGVTGTNNSDVDVGEINLADMNPDDIRAELKRLYTQLEVLKNKTIRADNPHISKRRGGRKVAHRRFSLQALHHRHQRCSTHHHVTEHEVTEAEVSRTPEDSVCSIEGPSAIYNDGPSTYSELGYGTPNVSYRVPHKQ